MASMGILPRFFETRDHQDRRRKREAELFEDFRRHNKVLSYLSIAQDGGLSEVSYLWKPGRMLNTLVVFCVIALNTINVIRFSGGLLYRLIMKEPLVEDKQLNVSEILVEMICPGINFSAEALVAIFEISGLVLLWSITLIYTYLCFSKFFRKNNVRKWVFVARLFMDVVPELKFFSAMRVLQYIAPPILTKELQHLVRQVQRGSRRRAVLRVGLFALTTFAVFIFGVDAFLVKFRIVAQRSLEAFPRKLDGGEVTYVQVMQRRIGGFINLVAFLNQLLGAVPLAKYLNARVMLFVFGGEDTLVSPEEHQTFRIWAARLYQLIWTLHKKPRAFMISLTFNDVDFQHLMLNERPMDLKLNYADH